MADTIEDAIRALSLQDGDRARLRNGVGFNGRDTAFGNSLAFQLHKGRKLSPRQQAAAHRMLRTYRVQLEGYGIRYANIPLPAAPAVKPKPAPIERAPEPAVRTERTPKPVMELTDKGPRQKRPTWKDAKRLERARRMVEGYTPEALADSVAMNREMGPSYGYKDGNDWWDTMVRTYPPLFEGPDAIQRPAWLGTPVATFADGILEEEETG